MLPMYVPRLTANLFLAHSQSPGWSAMDGAVVGEAGCKAATQVTNLRRLSYIYTRHTHTH
jgi:hypothetical protein